jgi:hypothetical protein
MLYEIERALLDATGEERRQLLWLLAREDQRETQTREENGYES